jgi:hypothetical protein
MTAAWNSIVKGWKIGHQIKTQVAIWSRITDLSSLALLDAKCNIPSHDAI